MTRVLATAALAAIAIAVGGCGVTGDGDAPAVRGPAAATFNQRVVALAASYPPGGFGGYAWPAQPGTAGTTRDLAVDGEVIAHGGDGNHCVGMTLEVFWRALEECPGGADGALDPSAARALKTTWYVPAIGGAGPADALPAAALGTRVALEDAQPGDFLQGWRADGLGHSAVFLGWQRDRAGTIIGVDYWSSQPWTDGIGIAHTAVGPADDAYDPTQVYLARAQCPPR